MALRLIASDSVIEFGDGGVIDGTATTTSSSVKALARRVMIDESIQGSIDCSGIGDAAVRLRPQKTRYRLELELLTENNTGLAAGEGNYGIVRVGLNGTTSPTYAGMIMSNALDIVDNQETIQRIVIEGPADA